MLFHLGEDWGAGGRPCLKNLPKAEAWHTSRAWAVQRGGRPIHMDHTPAFLLCFSKLSSCGSQWRFLPGKKLNQSTTHPAPRSMSFVQVLREHKGADRAQLHSSPRQFPGTWASVGRAMSFTGESFLGQPAKREKIHLNASSIRYHDSGVRAVDSSCRDSRPVPSAYKLCPWLSH